MRLNINDCDIHWGPSRRYVEIVRDLIDRGVLQPGQALPFEQVHTSVALLLRQQAWVNALRQYLQLLAGAAEVEGVQLDAADTPLVQ